MKSIETTNFEGLKALIRVDFNVPLSDSFEIADDTRMRAAIPTIKRVLESGGTAIIMSHLGRPKNGFEDKFSLRHLVTHLEKLSGSRVTFSEDCIGGKAEGVCSEASPGEIVLLENLRFHAEEQKGDAHFAESLSKLGDIYINDAFGTAHRAHASTTIIAQFFGENKMFGHLMLQEIESLKKVLQNPDKPVTAILGGAKIAGKIETMKRLMTVVDNILIGGGMSYTFIRAQGGAVGDSLVDNDKIEIALEILESAKQNNVNFHLPSDTIITKEFSNDGDMETVKIDQIPDNWIGLDIGEATIQQYTKIILESKTIIWNGPMGVFEMSNYEKGTKDIALAIAKATSTGAYSLIGGGDSVAAINQFNLAKEVSYVSTGGGALLEYMEGKPLPGVEAILN